MFPFAKVPAAIGQALIVIPSMQGRRFYERIDMAAVSLGG